METEHRFQQCLASFRHAMLAGDKTAAAAALARLNLQSIGSDRCGQQASASEVVAGEAALQQVSSADKMISDSLRVSAPAALSDWLLTPALLQLGREFTSARFQVNLLQRHVCPQGHMHDTDVMLTNRPVHSSRHWCQSLGWAGSVLVASPQWIARIPRPLPLQALAQCDFISLPWQPEGLVHRFRSIDNSWVKVRFKTAWKVDDIQLAMHLCEAGAGFALLPKPLVADACSQSRLRKLFRTHQYPPFELHAACRRANRLLSMQQRLVQLLKSQMLAAN